MTSRRALPSVSVIQPHQELIPRVRFLVRLVHTNEPIQGLSCLDHDLISGDWGDQAQLPMSSALTDDASCPEHRNEFWNRHDGDPNSSGIDGRWSLIDEQERAEITRKTDRGGFTSTEPIDRGGASAGASVI